MKKRKKYYYHQQIRINADVCAVNYFSEASRRVKPNVQTLKRKKENHVGWGNCMHGKRETMKMDNTSSSTLQDRCATCKEQSEFSCGVVFIRA